MEFEFSVEERDEFERTVAMATALQREFDSQGDGDLRRAWEKLAHCKLSGIPIPRDWGGEEKGALATSRTIEALTCGGLDSGLVFSLCAHLFTCAVPIWKAGTDAQRRRFLTPLAKGQWVGANATTEPDVGSDLSGLQVTAKRVGDKYVLNGTKWFSSNAPVANLFVVYATVDIERGFHGVTALIVERSAAGLTVLEEDPKIGLDASPFGKLVFKDCEIPAEQRLGQEGAGAAIFAESMRWERTCLFALYVGVMQRQLQSCLEFAKNRRQFGQSIGKFQSISNRIVDMRLRLETSRLLLYRASWLLERGRRCDLDVALCKLHVSESAVASSLDAIQIHGGRGCLREFGVEVDLRDAVPARIFSGTSEIQRMIIARCMGL